MSAQKHAVILLPSSTHALQAEKMIKQAGIACKLIPVPRQISSECGICVRIDAADRQTVIALLAARRIHHDDIIDL